MLHTAGFKTKHKAKLPKNWAPKNPLHPQNYLWVLQKKKEH